MLDETLDLDDLKTVDPEYHRGLMDILGSPLDSIGMDGLTFTTETSFFGCISTVDLVPRGSTILVCAFVYLVAAVSLWSSGSSTFARVIFCGSYKCRSLFAGNRR